MPPSHPNQKPRAVIGRYVLFGEIASGGMATVHFGRLVGQVGFTRTVAIKRMLPHCAKDPDFSAMFIDEARLVARIRHPNVVPVLDILAEDGELSLVMDYVQGEALWRLLRSARAQGEPPHVRVLAAIMTGVLEGLHAAHEAVSEQGEPLGIVHRDVSPQNIIVGSDGVPRVLDFGIAKATVRLHTTRDGELKGKLMYMSPEQIRRRPVDRRTDIYAAAAVMWEALAGRPLFVAETEAAVMCMVLEHQILPLKDFNPSVPPALEAVVMRGLQADPDARFATAQQMAAAIEDAVGIASPREVARWVEAMASDAIKNRAASVAEVENISSKIDLATLAAEAGLPQGSGTFSDSARFADSRPLAGTGESESSLASGGDLESIQPERKWHLKLLLIMMLVGAIVGVATVAMLQRSAASSSTPIPSASAPSTPVATSASAVAEPIASVASSATIESGPRTGPEPRKTPPLVVPAPPKSAPGTPAAPAGCNPPYTIDKEGLRVPKPHCL